MNLLESSIRFLSSFGWQFTLVAQVAILGTLAYLLVRSMLRQSPFWANRVWFFCAMGLLLLPVLLLAPNYTLSIASTASLRIENQPSMENPASLDGKHVEPENDNRSTNSGELALSSMSPRSMTSSKAMPSDVEPHERAVIVSPVNNSVANKLTPFVVFSLSEWINWRTVYWLYGLVVCGLALRLLRACVRLAQLHKQAIPVSDASTLELLDRAADVFGLRKTPKLGESADIQVPLAFGLFTPKVLVPAGFCSWSAEDRRAVLYHELAHVSRRDMLGEALARTVRIVYWFHPVAWLVAYQLRQSQELAADQRVIEAGLDRATYARALVNIISTMGCQRNAHDLPALAMSSMNDVQQRVTAIMCWRNLRAWRRGLTLCALLMIALGVSTIRVQLVAAAIPPVEQFKPETNETASQQVAAIPPVEADDNDLIRRLSKCEVLTVTGDDHDGVFNVSGVVVNAAGEPVSGAVVVLRESPHRRVNVLIRKGEFKFAEDRWKILPDVFARTLTDDNGGFEFKNIKAPSLYGHWTGPWHGSIVAGHVKLGVGWSNLTKKVQSDFTQQDIKVILSPSSVIEGSYKSPDQQPLPGQLATIGEVKQASKVKSSFDPFSSTGLELYNSQIAPRALTSSEGTFSLKGLPGGTSASILIAQHERWQTVSKWVSTGTRETEAVDLSGSHPILTSPLSLVSDPGEAIRGRVVDTEGNGIANVTVRYSSSEPTTATDPSGNFEIRRPTGYFKNERTGQRNDGVPVYFHIKEKDSNRFLSQSVKIDPSELIDPSKIDLKVTLQRGALVKGKVVNGKGEPLQNCLVLPKRRAFEFGDSGKTDKNGNFQLLLPIGWHLLVVSSDEPELGLPSIHRATFPRANDDLNANCPVGVDSLDDIEIDPIIVHSLPPFKVSVTLKGTPIQNATVRYLDPEYRGLASSIRQARNEANTLQTGTDGTVEFTPPHPLSIESTVEANWTFNGKEYFGTVAFSQSDIEANEIRVDLAENMTIEGRVTLNGKPWPNVSVRISQDSMVAARNLDRFVKVVETDDTGKYQLSVPSGSKYDAFIAQLPDGGSPPRYGRSIPSQSSKHTVEDFAFFDHQSEIAGQVVDSSGNPVAGIQVTLKDGKESSTWRGHQDRSQFETDQSGRFHLRNIPEGVHDLHVYRNQSGRLSTTLHISKVPAGEMNLRIELNTGTTSQPKRLQPKEIRDQ